MGFSVKEIKDLMDKMQQTGLGELEVEDEGYTLKLSAKKAKKTVENVMMAPAAPVVSAAPIAAAPPLPLPLLRMTAKKLRRKNLPKKKRALW